MMIGLSGKNENLKEAFHNYLIALRRATGHGNMIPVPLVLPDIIVEDLLKDHGVDYATEEFSYVCAALQHPIISYSKFKELNSE